jgi:hypothetical protein
LTWFSLVDWMPMFCHCFCKVDIHWHSYSVTIWKYLQYFYLSLCYWGSFSHNVGL